MFRANRLAVLRRFGGKDVHGRQSFAPDRMIGIAIVKLELVSVKTTVRADSSASRGAAEETVTKGKILVDRRVTIGRDDQVQIGDDKFRVVMTHQRFTTAGALDHTECDLESQP